MKMNQIVVITIVTRHYTLYVITLNLICLMMMTAMLKLKIWIEMTVVVLLLLIFRDYKTLNGK